MKVGIISQSPCSCLGCRFFTRPKDGSRYCKNSRAIWYLRSTMCRCDLREPEDPGTVEMAAFAEKGDYENAGDQV